MVVKDLEKMKEKLSSIENIVHTRHLDEKLKIRKIEKDLINSSIRNPKNLLRFHLEIDKYPGEKYELFFSLSKRKLLKIVVSFRQKSIYVVTSHIISEKRLKWVEKWRKKRT